MVLKTVVYSFYNISMVYRVILNQLVNLNLLFVVYLNSLSGPRVISITDLITIDSIYMTESIQYLLIGPLN